MIWIAAVATLLVLAVLLWRLWPTPLGRVFQAAERQYGHLHSRSIRCGALVWHYLEGGHGEPLILLHGFNGDADHFAHSSRYLSRHFRVLAPDMPGFGKTIIPEEFDFRVDALAARVLDWIDALGIGQFHLGGSSMGGYVATAVARQAPERVRGLLLLAPGGLRSAPLAPVFEEVEQGRHNPLIVRDLADFKRLSDFCFVHPPWIPGPLRRMLAARAATTSQRAQHIFDTLRYDSRSLEELANGLETPALIIWGDSDQVLHPAGLELLAALLPNSRSLLMPDTGHLPMIERPAKVAETWMEFTKTDIERA